MNIYNFGSLNIDKVYKVDHIVRPGETISSKSLLINAGGKGANQSAALAKAGMKVFHVGKIGMDGMFILDLLEDCNVNIDNVLTNSKSSGQAIIQVSENDGQNSIILFPGGNKEITKEEIDEALKKVEKNDILVLQNEISNVDYLISGGREKDMFICFNPSPFNDEILKCDLNAIDMFFVNEIEAAQMIDDGINHSYEELLKLIQQKFSHSEIILTVGKDGAYYSNDKESFYQPIIDSKRVDTTAAGDTFMGYFIASRVKGLSPKDSLLKATLASSFAVSRVGALESIPVKEEVF